MSWEVRQVSDGRLEEDVGGTSFSLGYEHDGVSLNSRSYLHSLKSHANK